MDDTLMIELLRHRDESALAYIRQKYEKLCFYIAGNILSRREDIEECVNSAYFELWNKIPPDAPDDLKTYLCRIVKNKALDRLKYNIAAKRNDSLNVPLDELAECIPDRQSVPGAERELAKAISDFLRGQDELHRKVFVRRYWYGDTLARIAGYYGLNEKTVATYLFRTRKKLKAYLKKEGHFYE